MKSFEGRSIYFMVSVASGIVTTPLVIYLTRASTNTSVGTHTYWGIVLVGLLYVLVQRFALRINHAQFDRNYVVPSSRCCWAHCS